MGERARSRAGGGLDTRGEYRPLRFIVGMNGPKEVLKPVQCTTTQSNPRYATADKGAVFFGDKDVRE